MKCTVLYITWEDTRYSKKSGGTQAVKGSARPRSEDFTSQLWLCVLASGAVRLWLRYEEGQDERITLTMFYPNDQLNQGNLPQPPDDHLAIFNALEV